MKKRSWLGGALYPMKIKTMVPFFFFFVICILLLRTTPVVPNLFWKRPKSVGKLKAHDSNDPTSIDLLKYYGSFCRYMENLVQTVTEKKFFVFIYVNYKILKFVLSFQKLYKIRRLKEKIGRPNFGRDS